MRLYTVLLYFLQTVLHVSDDTLIHHEEHTQTVITSGTGRTAMDKILVLIQVRILNHKHIY